MKYTCEHGANNVLQALYLSWVNDFLTYERFAEYYGVSVEHAQKLIELGRANHEEEVRQYKKSLQIRKITA